MKITKFTSRGRLTIPKKLRKKYNIKPGTRINFFEEDDGIKIVPFTSATIKANIGFLGKDGPGLLKVLMEEKRFESHRRS